MNYFQATTLVEVPELLFPDLQSVTVTAIANLSSATSERIVRDAASYKPVSLIPSLYISLMKESIDVMGLTIALNKRYYVTYYSSSPATLVLGFLVQY